MDQPELPINELIEIKKLIPHREPVIMVDALVSVNEKVCKTELTVDEKNLFVKNEFFQESGLIEHIAQSCALKSGYLNRKNKTAAQIGYLAAINSISIIRLPRINDTLSTKISTLFATEKMRKIKAVCSIKDEIIAKAEMTLVLK